MTHVPSATLPLAPESAFFWVWGPLPAPRCYWGVGGPRGSCMLVTLRPFELPSSALQLPCSVPHIGLPSPPRGRARLGSDSASRRLSRLWLVLFGPSLLQTPISLPSRMPPRLCQAFQFPAVAGTSRPRCRRLGPRLPPTHLPRTAGPPPPCGHPSREGRGSEPRMQSPQRHGRWRALGAQAGHGGACSARCALACRRGRPGVGPGHCADLAGPPAPAPAPHLRLSGTPREGWSWSGVRIPTAAQLCPTQKLLRLCWVSRSPPVLRLRHHQEGPCIRALHSRSGSKAQRVTPSQQTQGALWGAGRRVPAGICEASTLPAGLSL